MEAEDVDPARSKTVGHPLQVLAGRLFIQEVAETVEGVVGCVDGTHFRRFRQAKIGHVRGKKDRLEFSTHQAAPQIGQRRPVLIEADHAVAAGRKLCNQPSRATGRFEQSPRRKGTILAARRLDKVRLARRF